MFTAGKKLRPRTLSALLQKAEARLLPRSGAARAVIQLAPSTA